MAEVQLSRKESCRKCCQSCMTVVFSTLGLIVLIVSYTVVGGFLFRYLEAPGERAKIIAGRQMAEEIRNNYTARLWNITYELNILHSMNWTEEVEEVLKMFEEQIYNVTKYHNWDGITNTEAEVVPLWSFAGALLYALTAITTIGYGHVAPKTPEGQLVTIFYCIIGLPLTLMCIAKLGKAFAYVFRVIYYTCCCAICCVCCLASQKRRRRSVWRGSDEFSGPLSALVIGRDGPGSIKVGDKTYKQHNLSEIWCRRVKSKYKVGRNHDNAVPTSLCLVVMAAYIFGGAFLFTKWEPNWEIREGAYFCFITLTTIGFGDYVPGVDRLGSDSVKVRNQNLVLCALYVFIGLAFIGMCIDLMQVDVISKVRWIGRTLGLSESKKRKTHTDHKKARVGLKLSSDALATMCHSGTSSSLREKAESMNSYHNLGIPSQLDCNGKHGSMTESAIFITPYIRATGEKKRINSSKSEPTSPLGSSMPTHTPPSRFLSYPPVDNNNVTKIQKLENGSPNVLRIEYADEKTVDELIETVLC